jgi:chloramphenicol O-acetyltransferase type A
MKSGHYLDIDQWKRRAQFEFFRDYDIPFFNVCGRIKVTNTVEWCRNHEQSFALACWYQCQLAVNDVEDFRYRFRGDKVWVHDKISIGTTVLQKDETFQFAYFPYSDDFATFSEHARSAMDSLSHDKMDDHIDNDAMIHGSTLPWVNFTSISHPRRFGKHESVPKIVFGRYSDEAGELMMPVSVEVHHSLMDGIHVSRFFQQMEKDMNRPEDVLV